MIKILHSKLNTNYKAANLSCLTGNTSGIDPIFAGRLAYLASVNGVKFAITEGYRTRQRQTELYNRFLRGEIISAAKPGTSWHEFRLAVDTSSLPIRRMTNAQLKPYGLCKPISAEGWHVQPIETLGQTDRNKWAPIDSAALVKAKFALSDSTIAYMSAYKYAEPLFEGLLNGKRDFAAETINYLSAYQYWPDLKIKLGL